MSSSVQNFSLSVDTDGMKRLALDFRAAAPAVYVQTRKDLLGIARIVKKAAQGKASSVSATIPSAIKVSSSGLDYRVRCTSTLGSLFEEGNRGRHGGKGGGFFKHPVYGNMTVWVTQPMHPFLGPAFDEHAVEVRAIIDSSVLTAFRTVNLAREA